MQRVILAFVFVPLFASFIFGPLFLVVAPLAWITCLVLATPLFILFSRNGWLRCWQVVLAGLVCGLVTVSLLTLADGLYSTVQGPANIVMSMGLGGVIAHGFWWFGLYRNPRFGNPGGVSPLPALYPLPVLVGFGLLYVLYTPSISDAVALAEQTSVVDHGAVKIQLSDGTIAVASLADSGLHLAAGEKVTVETRRSVTLVDRRYWVIARAGRE